MFRFLHKKARTGAPQAVSESTAPKNAAVRTLDDVVKEIMTLDRQLNKLATDGQGKSNPEWQRCDDRLMVIGKELHAEGGEERMADALELAQAMGMRGRYVERHWTGIGNWMG